MDNLQLKEKIRNIKQAYPNEVKVKQLETVNGRLDLLANIGAKSSDIASLKEIISKLNKSIVELGTIQRISKTEDNTNHNSLLEAQNSLLEAIRRLPDDIETPEIPDNKKDFEAIRDAIKKLKLDPKIEVKPTPVNIDLKPLEAGLQAVLDAVESIEIPEPAEIPETDLTPVTEALLAVEKMVEKVYKRPIPVPTFNHSAIVSAVQEQNKAPTANVSTVSATTSTATLAAANTNREGLYIFNDSTATIYVKLGTSASTTDYTFVMYENGYYEMPLPVYTGAVTAVWASATGQARITELE